MATTPPVMTILVTGSSGQLALSLMEAATAMHQGDCVRVIAVGRPHLDLASPVTIQRACDALQPDLVVNAAAYTAVDAAQSAPDDAFLINAAGAGHVARVAANVGCPIIHISTDYVFDGTKRDAYVESDPVAPANVYGRTKLEGERLVADACAQHVILRTAWVHSPFGANFTKTMLRLAETRDALSVVDDQMGTPTYALHLAEAILAIAKAVHVQGAAAPWGTYHVAGQGETTWYGMAREIFLQSKRLGGASANVDAIGTMDYPTSARRPANSRLCCDHLRDALGVTLPMWQDGVAECVDRLIHSKDAGPLADGDQASGEDRGGKV